LGLDLEIKKKPLITPKYNDAATIARAFLAGKSTMINCEKSRFR
jgi:hypothetical protein